MIQETYDLDEEQIQKEEMYDGFYAVITNLEGDVSEIIRINKQRWEIEENFRIMKTEFEARPIYVRRENRIKAHFMTCYISLLLYRLPGKETWESLYSRPDIGNITLYANDSAEHSERIYPLLYKNRPNRCLT